ncbi:hypothetical protein EDD85DRAFT_841948 [Armillaria nabsnona]|nr:hypothetical protein EDD85DRAFT_841948 [Armillaria nabsnona]
MCLGPAHASMSIWPWTLNLLVAPSFTIRQIYSLLIRSEGTGGVQEVLCAVVQYLHRFPYKSTGFDAHHTVPVPMPIWPRTLKSLGVLT